MRPSLSTRLCICSTLLFTAQLLWSQPLEVTNAPPITPQNLITNVFLGEGVEVINVQYQGTATSVGFFKNGQDEVGIDRGIVMTTGLAVTANAVEHGVNSNGSNFANINNNSLVTDPDLQAIAGNSQIFNVTKYIITFIPISDTLRFKYAFGSEEYPEFACSPYNDIFGFFISGPGITGPYQNNAKNIALIPGTNLPVRINNVNSGQVGAAGTIANCTPPNGSLNYSQYYNDNDGSGMMPVYDGMTDVFIAEAVVQPCQTYTIKLVICDVSDSAYDSGVFLEAKSFGTGSLKVKATTVSLDGSVAEGCAAGTLTFSLPSPTESDYPIDYNIIGTATNGVDYQNIPPDLFIPAGDSTISIPIIALEDALTEGTETLILDVQRDVCNRDTIYVYIKDNPLVEPDLGLDQSFCEGTAIQLDGTLNVPVPEPPCFSNTNNLSITPTNVPKFSDVQVGGVLPPILEPGVIRSVCIDSLSHRWIDDIDAYLIGPNGQYMELTTDNGGNGGNNLGIDYYLHTCFTPEATTPINFPGPFAPPSAVPFTGIFLPEGVWSDMWDGNNKNTNGTWRLQLVDDTNGLDGTLHSWTICFNPAYEINYSWAPGDGLSCADCPNPTAQPAQATNYVMTATDSYGCVVSDSILIEPIEVLDAPNASCGTATESALSIFWDDQSGATGFEVNVDNGGWVSANSGLSHSLNGLVTGQSVTFQVRALGDCPGNVTTLTCETLPCSPADVLVNTTGASCNGGADGSVNLNATGGLGGPYTYSFDGNTNSSGSFSGISAGNYVATVTDAGGCAAPIQFTIDQPEALNTTPVSTAASCNGASDGSASVIITGGAGPYNFNWSNLSVDSIAVNLAAGDHSVTITDANGCPSTLTIAVSEPSAVSLTTSAQQVSCFGLADGEAQVQATGGTGAYTYLWDAAAGNQASDIAIGLTAGTYQVTVADANNCQANTSVQITENPALQIQASATDALCNGALDGTAEVIASGGTGTYAYAWTLLSDNSNVGASATVVQLGAGDYQIVVSDGNGCMQTAVTTIGQPAAITINAALTPPLCNGQPNGIAQITASGGAAGFTYEWNDIGLAPATRNDLTAGSYNVLVTDANNCQNTYDFVLTQPTPVNASVSTLAVSCNGGANGQATVTASGGVGNYTYSWTGGQQTSTATMLSSGPVSVTVTDGNGCTFVTQATVAQPNAITLSTSGVNPSCFGGADGTATVTATGGSGGFQYTWSNNQQTSTAGGLAAGTHSVLVTDVNGCTANASVTLSQPTLLTVTSTNGMVTCNGAADGSLTATASGGTGPYIYQWNDPAAQQSATANGLSLGNFTVIATDSKGCTASANAQVTGVSAINLTLTPTPVRCFGGNDGAISVAANGGAGTYSYNWGNAGIGNTATPNALTAGIYNVTVSDVNNCIASASIEVTQPSALSISGTATDARCADERSGSVDIQVGGGTAPYNYQWSNNAIDEDLADIGAGTYHVTVSDANGCLINLSRTINEPAALRVEFEVDHVDCYGEANGSITSAVSGGIAPYQYTWSNNNTNTALSNVVAGEYELSIVDANGCELITPVEINQPDEPLTASLKAEGVSCFGNSNGVITVLPSGGTPVYSYSLDGQNYGGSSIFIGLDPGVYSVYIRDAKGCAFRTDAAEVPEPEPLEVDLGPNQTINYGEFISLLPQLSGIVGAPTFEWISPNSAWLSCTDCVSPLVTIVNQASFELEVTDENGCKGSDIITIFVIKNNEALVPSGFTPNSDNLNDRLMVHGKADMTVLRFRVFDRWGELLFESKDTPPNDPNFGWDGSFRGQPMNSGEYIWHLEVKYADGSLETLKGSTTLIR